MAMIQPACPRSADLGRVDRDEQGRPVHGELHAGDGGIWLHREQDDDQFRFRSPRALGVARRRRWRSWSMTSTHTTAMRRQPVPCGKDERIVTADPQQIHNGRPVSLRHDVSCPDQEDDVPIGGRRLSRGHTDDDEPTGQRGGAGGADRGGFAGLANEDHAGPAAVQGMLHDQLSEPGVAGGRLYVCAGPSGDPAALGTEPAGLSLRHRRHEPTCRPRRRPETSPAPPARSTASPT